MTTTFAAFNAIIQNEINDNTAAMLLRIESWTNDAHYEICNARDWHWLEKVSDSTTLTSANTPFAYATTLKVATVTTLARKLLDVIDVSKSPNEALIFCTDQQLRQAEIDYSGYTSEPEYWLIQAGLLKVFPGLDTTGRAFTMRFVQDAAPYTAGSTSALLIPDRHIATLKAAVLHRVWSWLNDTRAPQRFAEFGKLFTEMKTEDAERAPIIYSQWFIPRTRLPRVVTGV